MSKIGINVTSSIYQLHFFCFCHLLSIKSQWCMNLCSYTSKKLVVVDDKTWKVISSGPSLCVKAHINYKWHFGGHFRYLQNSCYIDIDHILRDNALKFYRDYVYVMLQKTIDNLHYVIKNCLLAFFLGNSGNYCYINRGQML